MRVECELHLIGFRSVARSLKQSRECKLLCTLENGLGMMSCRSFFKKKVLKEAFGRSGDIYRYNNKQSKSITDEMDIKPF